VLATKKIGACSVSGVRRMSSARANPLPSGRLVSTITASGGWISMLRLAQPISASAGERIVRFGEGIPDATLHFGVTFDHEHVGRHGRRIVYRICSEKTPDETLT
jgi:hypothetical protein